MRKILLKNDDINLKIDSISGDGSGVGRTDEGEVVFVPKTARGDIVRAHVIKKTKSYAVAKVLELIEPSSVRIAPDCGCFDRCGGCVYRHIDYKEELDIKTQAVRASVKRIGGIDIEVCDTLSASLRNAYRNKAQYPVSFDLKSGFYAFHSHRIISESLDCKMLPENFAKICKRVLEYFEKNGLSGYDEIKNIGFLRNIYIRENSEGKCAVCLVLTRSFEKDCADALFEKLLPFGVVSLWENINNKAGNAILSDDFNLLCGEKYLTDTLLNTKLSMTPASFYQVNRAGAEKVYSVGFDTLEGMSFDTVYDLYCGIGSIGLTLFKNIEIGNLDIKTDKLVGVEISKGAVECAKHNAKNNGIKNASFYHSDSTDITKTDIIKNGENSLVILDPPRKGSTRELLEFLANKRVSYILYISCDHATLARDMSILFSLGYSAQKVQPVDIFPGTKHVETVVLLSRQKVDDNV